MARLNHKVAYGVYGYEIMTPHKMTLNVFSIFTTNKMGQKLYNYSVYLSPTSRAELWD